jgi:hypothetical protein
MLMQRITDLFYRPEPTREEEPPGRTFTRVDEGDYFGAADKYASKWKHEKARALKCARIKELGLKPAHARFIKKKRYINGTTREVTVGVIVSFRKERYNERQHMIHVSEMRFFVRAEEFEIFTQMCDVKLSDFRDLGEQRYEGIERRRAPRREMPAILSSFVAVWMILGTKFS